MKKGCIGFVVLLIIGSMASLMPMESPSEEVHSDEEGGFIEEEEECIEDMPIYGYKKDYDIDTDGSYEDYYPIQTHLCVEVDIYLYFVPFQNTLTIVKLDTSDGSVSLITTETGAIIRFYLDRTGEKLYFIHNLNIVAYVDLTDDTVSADYTTTTDDPGTLGAIEDIIVYDGDLFVIDTAEDDLTFYKYDSVGDEWDNVGTVSQGATNYINLDTVSSGANTVPYAICWDGTYFYIGDDDGYVYKYASDFSSLEGTIDIDTISSGANTVLYGMCFDGTYFYISDATAGKVFKYNSAFDTLEDTINIDTISSNANESPYGITWDGTYFYIVDGDGYLYKYNSDFDTLITPSITLESLGVVGLGYGIEFDSTFFYIIDNTGVIYKIDQTLTTLVFSINIGILNGNDSPQGITWDDNFLYVTDGEDGYVYIYFNDLKSESGLILYSAIISDKCYVVYQYIGQDIILYMKDLDDALAPTLVETFTSGYIIPYSENQRGLAVSSDDTTLSFVLKKASDGKTYFCTVSDITGTPTFTVGGEFNVAIMLNRNSNESNDPPFNTEKGFGIESGVNDLMIYQIIERGSPTNRLKKISDLTNLADFNGMSIKAITDHYIIAHDGTDTISGSQQDFSSYYTSCTIDHPLISFNHPDREEKYRGVPYAELIYNGNYLKLEKGMFLQEIGTGRINATTYPTMVRFEGIVERIADIESGIEQLKSNTKVAFIVNPAIQDLHYKAPSGTFSGDTDAILDDFDDDWEYITKGTYDDGPNEYGSLPIIGDKPYVQYIVEHAGIDNFIARLRSTGELDYNDGSNDSGIDYSETFSNQWKRDDRLKQYNQLTISGAYVNGMLVSGAQQVDSALVASIGPIPLEITISHLNTTALCNTAGAGLLTRLKEDLIILVIGGRDGTNYILFPGETVTISHSPRGFTSTQMLITRTIFESKTGMVTFYLSDSIRVEPEDFDSNEPQTNSEHIGQISTYVSSEGGDNDKTGWDPDVVVALSFTDGTRTFTITPTGTATYYINNVKYSISVADTVVIDDTEGLWFIYYSEGTLTASQASWTITDNSVCYVSILYWDATNNVHEWLSYDCHTWVMDARNHDYLHENLGTQISSGGTLSEMSVDGDASLDAHCQFQNDATIVSDEDIKITQATRTKTTNIAKYYRLGADASNIWRIDENDPYPIVLTGGAGEDRAAWNDYNGGTWQLVEVTDNQFVLAHIFISTDKTRKFGVIIGQAEYATKTAARAGAETELASIITEGLPAREYRFLATIIIQTKDTYANTPKSKIVSTAEGGDYIDWTTSLFSRIGITSASEVSDEAYSSTWDGVSTIAPSKNAVYDEISTHEALTTTAHGIDALLRIGSSNAKYGSCIFLHEANSARSVQGTTNGVQNVGGTDINLTYLFPKDKTLGALKLYITKLKLVVSDADGGDYIDVARVYDDAGNQLYNQVNPNNDQDGNLDSPETATHTFPAAIDCSSDNEIYVYLFCVNTNAGDLNINAVQLEYYYDT